MNKMVFERNGKTIVRVNKAKARKMYNNGIDVLFIPCNLRPDSPYMLGAWENINLGDEKIPFEKLVDYFEIYNCIDSETGKYTAFYIEKEEN